MALSTFVILYHHLHVPAPYTVPSHARWPAATWGLPLGGIVSWLRAARDTMAPDRAAELNALGFEWTACDFDD
ncbi:hypothetical protein ACHHYP_20340 [Achlya hypogyna]|uniref:Helicase-associated domain-containing protein n=1 Tax=Achlya hypogyna TaxID=1202772 RepID=A0A1V9YQB2_ACHHY|nr:hypothetical protein ACHHYP_20340 [Achlya hypogyna]